MAVKRSDWSKAQRVAQQLAVAVGLDPLAAARQARLRYVSDEQPGIHRKRRGKGFYYVDPEGKPIHDKETLLRIRSLVIPPAWTDVWICMDPEGHLQCTGRDARGRKQHRYHVRWRELRDEAKYARLVSFGAALPRIRKQVARDLKLPGLCRRRVLALLVQLLETTLIRVGNEEYARTNGSYGLTTLRDKHVKVRGATVLFRFHGKSGKYHEIDFSDRRLAQLVKRCQDLPGEELFQYVDDSGQRRSIGSADVNEYLREIAGEEFTAKDFRTWAGTMLAAVALLEGGEQLARQGRKAITPTVKIVAQRLGNTVAVCRKCYIHPAIFAGFLAGTLTTQLACLCRAKRKARAAELALLAYLAAADKASQRQAG